MDNYLFQTYIKEFQNQNFANFDSFYQSTKQEIFYNIISIVPNEQDAEELLQETYVTFLSHIKKVKYSVSPLGYLFKISRNLAYDFYRKNKNQVEFDDYMYDKNETSSIVSLELKELLAQIKKLLNESEYQIFILKTLHEYTHQEIAKMLHRPIGTITWKYNEAIKKLKKGLGDTYEW